MVIPSNRSHNNCCDTNNYIELESVMKNLACMYPSYTCVCVEI